MAETSILTTTQGAVRHITLNRPTALNSFTADMRGALLQALNDAAADTAVRAVVITGAGRAFCAGQDLADPAMVDTGNGPDVGAVIDRFYRPLALRVRSMPVPVLAAVNGVAAGAGANLALCCDLVLAARSASFIQAFSRIGLVPDCGGSWLLPRLVAMLSRALAETRRVLDEASTLDLPDALALEASAQRELGRGADFREGVAAFFAKRPPQFQDR